MGLITVTVGERKVSLNTAHIMQIVDGGSLKCEVLLSNGTIVYVEEPYQDVVGRFTTAMAYGPR